MNENIENRIIELIDAGKTAENSSELKDIIESSDEAKQFYYNFLKSDSDLKEFYGNALSKLDKQRDKFVNKKFNKNPLKQTNYFKPVIGLAIAASLATISFTFLYSPADIINTNNASSFAGVTLSVNAVVEPFPVNVSSTLFEPLVPTPVQAEPL